MISFSTSRLAALCLTLAAAVPQLSHAGILDDEEARKAILELRTKVDTVTRELNARIDTKSDKSSALELVTRQEQSIQEIAKLRGQIEVLGNELANIQRRQRDFYLDVDARLRKLEPQKVTIDGVEVTVEPAEQRAYDAAIVLFKSGDYKAAASYLGDFVRRYPDSAYAPAAQYWLGNAYYALNDYANAITAQQSVATTYPENAKAPDAMLNIGSSYSQLKDKKNAKKAFEALVAKYPGSNAAKVARERLASLK